MGLSLLGMEFRQCTAERVDKGLNTRKNSAGVGTWYLRTMSVSMLNR